MSWISDLFGGRRKRHARGNPSDDASDSDGYTRQIPRGHKERAGSEVIEWDPPSPDRFESRDVQRDAPTEMARARPAARPSAPPSPWVDSEPDEDNRTVLATASSVEKGKAVAVLFGIEGPLDGHVIRVFAGENVIGREGQPDPIPNNRETRTISRKHAMLAADGGFFAIEPVDEKNGTFVNGKVITERDVIVHGDQVRLGSSKPSTFVLLVVPS